MSKTFSTILAGFGGRLRQERERLGLTQAQLAEIGGVKRLAQSQYERESSYPTVRYLTSIGEAGIDLSFALFGQAPSTSELQSSQKYDVERQAFELLEAHVRQLPGVTLGAEGRFALFQLLKSQLTEQALSDCARAIRVTETPEKKMTT